MKKLIVLLLFISVLNLISCRDEEAKKEITVSKSYQNSESKGSLDTGIINTGEKPLTDYSVNKVISSGEVKNHIGDSLSIRGYVADVYVSEKVSYLNFENKFPGSVFSCAVFSSYSEAFGDLTKYKGKTVEVSGKITTYKNKPQVILRSPDQIKILK